LALRIWKKGEKNAKLARAVGIGRGEKWVKKTKKSSHGDTNIREIASAQGRKGSAVSELGEGRGFWEKGACGTKPAWGRLGKKKNFLTVGAVREREKKRCLDRSHLSRWMIAAP